MAENRERAVAFVVARLSSSRLAAKQLREIGGRSILDGIMQSLAGSRSLDDVVLTTVAEPANEPLRALAARRGWTVFWYDGAVDDVVGRLNRAADAHAADICLLVSADCPLVHGPSVDRLVDALRGVPDADCVTLPPLSDGRVCLLEGVQVARRAAWRAADALSDSPALREHQFPVIYRDPGRFRHLPVTLADGVYGAHHRLSVDTAADLEFMRSLHAALQRAGSAFSLPAAVARLSAEPSLRAINAHVHQRRLEEVPVCAVCAIDAGGGFGYGHYSRSREIASQLVERLGWSVRFVVDDEAALDRLVDAGFRVAWGAYGRPLRAPAPAGIPACQPGEAECDLLIVDVSARRPLACDGSAYRSRARRVAFIERNDGPEAEADLVVFPGASGRVKQTAGGPPAVLSGIEYAVLRREVTRLRTADAHKDIDLFVYLYDEDHRRQLREVAARHGWRLVEADGFDGFLASLARSRVFVSGFGQSFYEAVALGARPVAWPLSDLHARDAAAFFAAVGLPPLFLGSDADAAAVLGRALAERPAAWPQVADGTPRIVAALAALAESEGRAGISSGSDRRAQGATS